MQHSWTADMEKVPRETNFTFNPICSIGGKSDQPRWRPTETETYPYGDQPRRRLTEMENDQDGNRPRRRLTETEIDQD